MGVSGLLPILKSIQENTTLERYRGQTLAIDTYAWLHKASFTCAEDIVMERPTRSYINYFNKRIKMLQHFNITPYFVFDGDYLPRKAAVEKEREERRNEYKKLANDAKASGNNKLAFSHFQKACDISPELAKSLINELKMKYIKYVVAPYEADSQMVMLEKLGLVDGIISEDSDLLIFGCQKLITKLNDRGECIEIKRENFANCKGSYINCFNDDQLLLMATISGCDYTKGITGIGIQKAIQLTHYFKTYERVMMNIKVEGKPIPEGFDDEYKRAKIAFKYQIVFNPINQTAQHLNPVDNIEFDKDYLYQCTGFLLDQEIHKKIATGELDPFSKKVLISWDNKVSATATRSLSLPVGYNKNNSNNKYNRYNINNTVNDTILTNNTLDIHPLRLQRSKTENIVMKRTTETPPITKKRKSAMKIDQFTQFIRDKQNSNNKENNMSNNALSTTSKRQKLLNKNETGQPTISKFFSQGISIRNEKVVEKDVEINSNEFNATSSDVEDISEEEINNLNMKLSNGIKETQDDILTSDIEEEKDHNSLSKIRNEVNSSISENQSDETGSDMEDIINSSDISQSTITMDKSLNRNTPTSLIMNNNSSLTMSTDTDIGEVNTEYLLEVDDKDEVEEDGEGGELCNRRMLLDDSNTESKSNELIDKQNMLAEIYSFKTQNSNHNNHNNIMNTNKNRRLIDENEENRFNPSKWMKTKKINNSHRPVNPSPLQQRTALQDVTNGSGLKDSGLKDRGSRLGRSGLSRFRYQE